MAREHRVCATRFGVLKVSGVSTGSKSVVCSGCGRGLARDNGAGGRCYSEEFASVCGVCAEAAAVGILSMAPRRCRNSQAGGPRYKARPARREKN